MEWIDRQAAIDVLKVFTQKDALGFTPKQIVDALPSAQQERKEGTWIIQGTPSTGWFRVICSECGEDVTSTAPIIDFFPNAKCIWDFCPYCGVKMGGGQE